MMFTEQEAKTKRCCGPEGCGVYPVAMGTSEKYMRFCIGSMCMAWRKVDQIGIGPNGEKRDRDLDGRTRWVDRGYCGLAHLTSTQGSAT
jgi:hypothetical protein